MRGQDGSPGGRPADDDRQGWAGSFEVDLDVAQLARVHDALSEGKANFTIDREALDQMTEVLPGGPQTARHIMDAGIAFRRRAVDHLVGAGVRQFLSLGTNLPGPNRDHEVAQRQAPESRIVYWTGDPVVMAHAHELYSDPAGSVVCIAGDLQEPEGILRQAARTLDLAEPVAILIRVLASVPDDEAGKLVARFMAGLAAGSYLVILHLARDVSVGALRPASKRMAKLVREDRMDNLRGRTHAEVTRFFDGLDLVPPGVVTVDKWRPAGDGGPALPQDMVPPLYGGVGRKP